MKLEPGWVDTIAGTIEKGASVEEATGGERRRCFRIDWSRRRESAARGGRKGGRARKKTPQ